MFKFTSAKKIRANTKTNLENKLSEIDMDSIRHSIAIDIDMASEKSQRSVDVEMHIVGPRALRKDKPLQKVVSDIIMKELKEEGYTVTRLIRYPILNYILHIEW